MGIYTSSERVLTKIVDKSGSALWGLNLNHLGHTLTYGWDG